MAKYVWGPDMGLPGTGWVPVDDPRLRPRVTKGDGLQVVPDIEPYQSMIDGSTITSRRWHRQHLKNNNCIEVGNEGTSHVEKNKRQLSRSERRADIARVWNQYTT